MTFKCEWCRREQPAKELYDYNGFENFVGPMCDECVDLILKKRAQKEQRDGVIDKLISAKVEGYPVEKCPKCGQETSIQEGEGILSSGEHYKCEWCPICVVNKNKTK